MVLPKYKSIYRAPKITGNIIYSTSTQEICFYTGTEWLCLTSGGGGGGGDTTTDCIMEETADNGVAIQKPLFVNRHGIGRAHLTSNVSIDDTPTILNAGNFTLDFESSGTVGTGGPTLLLTGGNVFTAPIASDYPNSCLNYTTMYVDMSFITSVEMEVNETLEARYRINGVDSSYSTIIKTTNSGGVRTDQLVLKATLALSPGDTVNISLVNETRDCLVLASHTIFTATILGFEN
jgi:hypothetical protein